MAIFGNRFFVNDSNSDEVILDLGLPVSSNPMTSVLIRRRKLGHDTDAHGEHYIDRAGMDTM